VCGQHSQWTDTNSDFDDGRQGMECLLSLLRHLHTSVTAVDDESRKMSRGEGMRRRSLPSNVW